LELDEHGGEELAERKPTSRPFFTTRQKALETLSSLTNLRSLDIDIDDRALDALTSVTPDLKELRIVVCAARDDGKDGSFQFEDILAQNVRHFVQLEYLNIFTCMRGMCSCSGEHWGLWESFEGRPERNILYSKALAESYLTIVQTLPSLKTVVIPRMLISGDDDESSSDAHTGHQDEYRPILCNKCCRKYTPKIAQNQLAFSDVLARGHPTLTTIEFRAWFPRAEDCSYEEGLEDPDWYDLIEVERAGDGGISLKRTCAFEKYKGTPRQKYDNLTEDVSSGEDDEDEEDGDEDEASD